MVEPYGVYGDPLFAYHHNGAGGIRQLDEKDGEQGIGLGDRRFSNTHQQHHQVQLQHPHQHQHHQPQSSQYPTLPPPQPTDRDDLENVFGLTFLESDHNTAQMGIMQWNELVATRQLAQALQTQLRQAARDRDQARLQASTLRNEVYAARQVEKRLRIERDEARSQVAFLKRERAEGRRTEFRLRRERNEARMALVLTNNRGDAASTGHGSRASAAGEREPLSAVPPLGGEEEFEMQMDGSWEGDLEASGQLVGLSAGVEAGAEEAENLVASAAMLEPLTDLDPGSVEALSMDGFSPVSLTHSHASGQRSTRCLEL
ncbi:hypothetical protein B0T19DRAFT_404159 [Cercophora scortea]|uniref:Uncharacterized protein n=1 Tax=Cercophora scortea TaxID=314031 RepID=A0AAE0I753_9PEZI|nr:hypothetical protein B0T19DRAFT_404159 [Cercophora scortea]